MLVARILARNCYTLLIHIMPNPDLATLNPDELPSLSTAPASNVVVSDAPLARLVVMRAYHTSISLVSHWTSCAQPLLFAAIISAFFDPRPSAPSFLMSCIVKKSDSACSDSTSAGPPSASHPLFLETSLRVWMSHGGSKRGSCLREEQRLLNPAYPPRRCSSSLRRGECHALSAANVYVFLHRSDWKFSVSGLN
jgi:hypothetical protein